MKDKIRKILEEAAITCEDFGETTDKILALLEVVGQSEQLVAFLEFVVDYKMLEVDLEYEEIVKRFFR